MNTSKPPSRERPPALSVYEGIWHSFQMMPGLPERDTALDELADFLRTRLAAGA